MAITTTDEVVALGILSVIIGSFPPGTVPVVLGRVNQLGEEPGDFEDYCSFHLKQEYQRVDQARYQEGFTRAA